MAEVRDRLRLRQHAHFALLLLLLFGQERLLQHRLLLVHGAGAQRQDAGATLGRTERGCITALRVRAAFCRRVPLLIHSRPGRPRSSRGWGGTLEWIDRGSVLPQRLRILFT